MTRAVVTRLPATRVLLTKAPTTPPHWEQEGLPFEAFDNIRNTDERIDETPIQEELQDPTTESNPTPIMASVVTRKGETENASIRPFSDTPRVETTPVYGATRRDANPTNTCGTVSTDSNEETERPGHTRPNLPHLRDRHVSRHSS